MNVDAIVKIIFAIVSYALIGLILALIGFLIINGLDDISWEFLTTFPSNSMTEGGVWPAIVGTVYFVTVALLFSIPVGILAAIYLSEYSKDTAFRRLILAANNILSGIPSVVFGLFGYHSSRSLSGSERLFWPED